MRGPHCRRESQNQRTVAESDAERERLNVTVALGERDRDKAALSETVALGERDRDVVALGERDSNGDPE